MNKPTRFAVISLALILLITLHFVLLSTHGDYARMVEGASSNFTPAKPPQYRKGDTVAPADDAAVKELLQPSRGPRRANATFVMLARNADVDGAVRSIRAIEDRFNKAHRYPYVFLNELPFSDEFKERVSVLSNVTMEFGVVPTEHWYQPEWIDEDKATKERARMAAARVKYGDSVAYRNMCRFNSGFFFKHELLQKYRWYWRIEPDVQFDCDIIDDPFLYMEDNDKIYGFTIAVYEIAATIPSLWASVQKFMQAHPEHIAPHNALDFISADNGRTYNTCHFWSNFEIADMDFWRGPAYTAFFAHLDATGGFYYERWGDAPVHSIAVALLARAEQIHFFKDIGYQHDDWAHCPREVAVWAAGRCACSRAASFDHDDSSCLPWWERIEG